MGQNLAHPEVRSCLDAFERHCETILANTNNPTILDATYEAQCIVRAMWPSDNSDIATVDRWAAYKLSPLESRIVDILFRRLGKAVANETLTAAWTSVGREMPGSDNIKVHMAHIRHKIRTSPWVINVVWGLGYRMELKDAQRAA